MLKTKLSIFVGLAFIAAGCGGGDDGNDDSMVMTLGMTAPATGADDGGGTAATGADGADDGVGTTAADDATDAPSDDATDDPPDDDATDDAAGCDPPCAEDENCIAGQCFGGDDGTTGEPPPECGTNVMLNDPECNDCALSMCCAPLQACFGDETVMAATPCLELNNCVAMNCGAAASLKEVEACIDKTCPELSPEFETWLAFQSCMGMSCAAACM